MAQPQQREATPAAGPGPEIVVTLPDHRPVWPVVSVWRAAVPTLGGLAPPEAVLLHAKPVALASRAERALVSALAGDRGQEVLEQAGRSGDHQTAAAVAAALRLADQHPDKALALLAWVRSGENDPATLRFVRRYLPGLRVFVALAPEIHANVLADSVGLGLLQAELLQSAGHTAEAISVLQALPNRTEVVVALTAHALAAGHAESVAQATEGLVATDDVSGVLAVLRARALRLTGRVPAALDTIERALAVEGSGRGFRLVALPERAEALRSVGRDSEADLSNGEYETLVDSVRASLATPTKPPSAPRPGDPADASATSAPAPNPTESTLPAAAAAPPPGAARAADVSAAALEAGSATATESTALTGPPGAEGSPLFGRDLPDALDDARARVRRQPRWGMAPGMFGGRPHRDYLDEVDELIRGGQVEAAESLLLGLLDAVDAEVDRGEPVDDTHFLTLAGLFARGGDAPEELATLERLSDSYRRSGGEAPEPVRRRIEAVRAELSALESGQSA